MRRAEGCVSWVWGHRGPVGGPGGSRAPAEGMLRGPCPLDAWLAWSRGPGQKVSLLSGRPGCQRPSEGLARTPPPAARPQAAGSLGARPRGEHPGDAGAGSCGIAHLFELGAPPLTRWGRRAGAPGLTSHRRRCPAPRQLCHPCGGTFAIQPGREAAPCFALKTSDQEE